MLNLFRELPLPRKPGDKQTHRGLHGSALSICLWSIAQRHNGPVVVLTKSTHQLLQIQPELRFLAQSSSGDVEQPILTLSDWEILPYDRFSPHQDIVSERLKTLYQLPSLTRGLVLCAAHTSLHRFCPKKYIADRALILKKRQNFEIDPFRTHLESLGYYAVSQVTQHGEFAIRGSIMDLFPMGAQQPYRIDLLDDEIDTIRTFDPETQRTLQISNAIQLLPAKEFPMDKEGISTFKKNWRLHFEGDPTQASPYQEITRGKPFAGLEYYAPLFFEKTESFFDYLPQNTLVISLGILSEALTQFEKEYQERYNQYRHQSTRPILPPKMLFMAQDDYFSRMALFPQLRLEQESSPDDPIQPLPDLTVQNQQRADPWEKLKSFIEQKKKILFSVETPGRREILMETFEHHGLSCKHLENKTFLEDSFEGTALTITPFSQGFWIPSSSFALITEDALFGERVMQRRKRQKRLFDPEASIRDLIELKIGDPIVHLEHGIGRYLGLVTLNVEGFLAEFLSLEYANHDKLYIPISALHLISRYSGAEHVELHKLGTGDWQKAKKKSIEKIKDIAAELLELQAKRSIKPGFPFDQHDPAYEDFANRFPFEETPDQTQAIQAVINDMRSPRHMDRLVCGDVGFGKTEVALRGAFLAAYHGKQVAVLVPTTLLAEQHAQTFRDRFAPWPLRIEVLSRFNTPKEEKKILSDLAAGKVDIVIGTHKLLQPKIKFHDVGLIVIDEEHRFGVKHKERFKSLRAEVDILTLTATPIPRTLNMALSQIRDLSIIATPPEKRLAIKTFVRERDPILIREAILREILRGGQVYFLHNNVQTIEKVQEELQAWVPEAKVRHAHGQMRESELERMMVDFYHQRFNVLVCTTIIETGIDIPSANTIIIDRADKLGLAQLHQLRGRVGRSHHQAYAYLFTPPQVAMTADAIKRLDAISQLEELGAGFTLAMQDLEIRGAGEFLGQSQSGHIESIGYSLYMAYLEEAVESLKSGKAWAADDLSSSDPEVNLHLPALIPEQYLPDVHLRLVFYKRMNHTKTQEELDDIQVELIDRFGLIPEATQTLFQLMAIKQSAREMGIKQIDMGPKQATLEFGPEPKINSAEIIRLIQQSPQSFKLDGPSKLKHLGDFSLPQQRIETLKKLLVQLKRPLV